MTSDAAESVITGTAVVVTGVYGYRKLVESTGKSSPGSVAHFAIGFGVVFMVLSVLAQATPELGALMAVLIAVGDLLGNGLPLVKDLETGLSDTATATKAK